MYCPVCKDEFRSGFTRCAGCDVDLVDGAPREEAARPEAQAEPSAGSGRLADYCGFTDIEDARDGRDRLRDADIGTDIVIREAPESPSDGPIVEEYWLRVETTGLARAVKVLGFDAADEHEQAPETPDDHAEGFDCGACGHSVSEHETSCPKCGAKFDDA